MFASHFRSIPILWSKWRGFTMLQTKIILANSWKWWFFAFYTHFYHNFIENSLKIEFYQTILMTLRAAQKFSVTFWHALCVFLECPRSISIRWSKRRGQMMLQSKYIVANSHIWWFFLFLCHSKCNFEGPKSVKIAFFTMFFEIQIAVENFLCVEHP